MGLLTAGTIRDRMVICTQCQYWSGVDHCLKGHVITTLLGCPIKQFPPVSGAGYAEDRVVTTQRSGCKSCGSMSAAETVLSLAQTFNAWRKTGYELASADVSEQRLNTCKACAHYDAGRCGICHCYMTLKTKLKAAVCPQGHW